MTIDSSLTGSCSTLMSSSPFHIYVPPHAHLLLSNAQNSLRTRRWGRHIMTRRRWWRGITTRRRRWRWSRAASVSVSISVRGRPSTVALVHARGRAVTRRRSTIATRSSAISAASITTLSTVPSSSTTRGRRSRSLLRPGRRATCTGSSSRRTVAAIGRAIVVATAVIIATATLSPWGRPTRRAGRVAVVVAAARGVVALSPGGRAAAWSGRGTALFPGFCCGSCIGIATVAAFNTRRRAVAQGRAARYLLHKLLATLLALAHLGIDGRKGDQRVSLSHRVKGMSSPRTRDLRRRRHRFQHGLARVVRRYASLHRAGGQDSLVPCVRHYHRRDR